MLNFEEKMTEISGDKIQKTDQGEAATVSTKTKE